jgi:hypothetical protein
MTKIIKSVPHSLSSVAARHPLHGIREFANEAERDAHDYSAKDVGKCIKVQSPLKYWLVVGQSGGTATFREMAPDVAAFVAGAFGSAPGTICDGGDSRLSNERPPTSHASSHLPGSADALATGAPGTITPGDDASEGSACFYAKSDHTHAIAPFGSAPGTFCEGSDARLGDDRTASGLRSASTTVAVAAAAAPSAGQVLTATGPATATWQTPASNSVWSPDVQPLSAHGCDDEFTAASLDAKWSTWDPGSLLTATIDADYRSLKLAATGNGSIRYAGIHQPVPDSEYAVYAKVGATGIAPGEFRIGIFVSDDVTANPSTADFRVLEVAVSATLVGWIVDSRTFAAYNGTPSTTDNISNSLYAPIYLRMRCNGTSFAGDFSQDGRSWWQISSRTLGFIPTHFGLCLEPVTNGLAAVGYVEFFRVFSGPGTSAMAATRIGRFL